MSAEKRNQKRKEFRDYINTTLIGGFLVILPMAILFIVFDIEVVFMYPWAVVFRELGLYGFVEMTVFMLVLGVGLMFAWRKGALEWK